MKNPQSPKPLVGKFDAKKLIKAVTGFATRLENGNFSGLTVSTWDKKSGAFIRRKLP